MVRKATQLLHPHNPGTIDFANCSILKYKKYKILIEKVSIIRIRLSADLYLLEQGDVLQLLSSFPSFWHLHFVIYTNLILAPLSDENSCYAMRSRLLNN